ncbi:hypothetical protein [Chryseobacterium sp. SIMBA_029]
MWKAGKHFFMTLMETMKTG